MNFDISDPGTLIALVIVQSLALLGMLGFGSLALIQIIEYLDQTVSHFWRTRFK